MEFIHLYYYIIKENSLKKIPLPTDMLVSTALEYIDYSDYFTTFIDTQRFTTIDTFVKRYFETQPRWLAMISMNLFSKASMQKALKNNDFTVDEYIGSWKIYLRNENEIVFGDDMGFMEYRFSMRIDDNIFRSATVVQYKGRMGKYYFALVKLLHQKFVLLSLQYPLKNKIRLP